VILFRCFPWDRSARADAPGGALWSPRRYQGDGRHDAPARYGCLYVAEEGISAVVEQLCCFGGAGLSQPDLVREGLPLALAALRLPERAELVDLDEPLVLAAEELRPSLVGTREREHTQAYATALFERHPEAVGIRWWSTFEPRWANVTLFDRGTADLEVEDVRKLGLADDVVVEAARFLGPVVAA
jgi:hypothetical protein